MSFRWVAQSVVGLSLVAGVSFAVKHAAVVDAAPQETAVNGECKLGYMPDADGKCVDIDECKVNNGECDPSVVCTNTPGSRTCGACSVDFTGDGYYGCKDPNDCAAGGCAPVDVKAPGIKTSGSQNVAATSADGAVAKFTAWAVDNIDGPVAVTCTPKSGSMFPMGATQVSCTAADKKGNKKTATFTINVK